MDKVNRVFVDAEIPMSYSVQNACFSLFATSHLNQVNKSEKKTLFAIFLDKSFLIN